ncbi:MAG TPA: ring-cleaving dioxygenase [Tepidisphaeraceae bacterium]|jgi:catechol 2,3-dioxygenase-like lactoylglutathione lyase family enzyme
MSTTPTIPGIHHITAITADAQLNINFYHGILGLRLVKLTVNFDDPSSYHLYYGDELGRPGTALTFFAWPGAYRGRVGPPQVTATAFIVPVNSLEFWRQRLASHQIFTSAPAERFGERFISFSDPDGMPLEIIASAKSPAPTWPGSPVPSEHAIRAFHSATISEEGYEKTASLLTDVMGFRQVASEQNRFRYRANSPDDFASTIDLLCIPDARHGTLGAGIVHHIAFRAADDAQQLAWRESITRAGLNVSPVMERVYFHSIYFREPGGVLFEIATDLPGFTADEPVAQLGKKLQLPPWLESHRAEIERSVPSINLP